MNTWKIETKRFGGLTESLYNDYSRVETLYPYNYVEENDWDKRIAWLDAHSGAAPSEVADALEALNRRLGATEAVLNNIEHLRAADALCVVTGQQIGLFTGPLYTIYKAATTIKQARALSNRTGRIVVPVFWMATEDHDYGEVASNWHFNGQKVRQLRLSREHRGNSPVGILPISESLENLCAELCDLIEEGPGREEAVALLQETLSKSSDLGQWFGRLISELFAIWGMVVLDPSAPEMRQVARPFFEKALLEAEAVEKAFLTYTSQVQEQGYHPEIAHVPGQTGMFLIEANERISLYKDLSEDCFTDKKGIRKWSRDNLRHMAAVNPQAFSTGVVLRPVLQDWLLPVAAAVLGPGEAAYHGQLRGVFNVMGREMPIIVPRESWVLAPDCNFLAAQDIESLITGDADTWVSDKIMDTADHEMRYRINEFNETYLDSLNMLLESLPISADARIELEKRAALMQKREMKKMIGIIKKALTAEAGGIGAFRSVAAMLRPMGKTQERCLLPWHFYARFGKSLISDLVESDFCTSIRVYAGGDDK